MKNLFLIFTLCNLAASDLLDEPILDEESPLTSCVTLNPILHDWVAEDSFSSCVQIDPHLLTEVSQSPESDRECVFCPRSFSTKHYLRRHLVASHANDKGFLLNFIGHGGKPESIYHCCECSFATLDKNYYLQHMARHSGIKLHHCNHCSRGFNCINDLRRHKFSIHHEDIPDFKFYSCSKCLANFTKKRLLVNHMVKHEEIPKSPSLAITSGITKKTKDDFKFDLPLTLARIGDPSSATRNFDFPTSFAPIPENSLSLENLVLPLKSEGLELLAQTMCSSQKQESTPLNCPECGLKAKNRANLLVHIARHQKKPLYFCDYCPWGCYLKNDLSRHIISKHLGQGVVANGHFCKTCQLVFPRKEQLLKHEKTH